MQVLFSEALGEPFTILHSVSHVQSGVHVVEVLLLRVQKDPQETTGSGYCVSLEWVTVAGAAGSGTLGDPNPASSWYPGIYSVNKADISAGRRRLWRRSSSAGVLV